MRKIYPVLEKSRRDEWKYSFARMAQEAKKLGYELTDDQFRNAYINDSGNSLLLAIWRKILGKATVEPGLIVDGEIIRRIKIKMMEERGWDWSHKPHVVAYSKELWPKLQPRFLDIYAERLRQNLRNESTECYTLEVQANFWDYPGLEPTWFLNSRDFKELIAGTKKEAQAELQQELQLGRTV